MYVKISRDFMASASHLQEIFSLIQQRYDPIYQLMISVVGMLMLSSSPQMV
jgi:hypothetical protein